MTLQRQFQLDRNSPTARGLVGLWGPGPAGGHTLYDMSGRGNHGTFLNINPTTDWIPDADRGWVLDFDGNDEMVQYGSNGMPTTGTVTVAFWIYLPTTVDRDQIYFSYDAPGRTLTAGIYSGRLFCAFDPEEGLDDASAHLTANTWNHLCFEWSGDREIDAIYVDGTSRTIDPTTGGFAVDGFVIGGRDPVNYDWPFLGRITDFRIYGRGVSAGEISHIYQRTLAEPYSDIQLRETRVFKAAAAPAFDSKKHLVIGGGVI